MNKIKKIENYNIDVVAILLLFVKKKKAMTRANLQNINKIYKDNINTIIQYNSLSERRLLVITH